MGAGVGGCCCCCCCCAADRPAGARGDGGGCTAIGCAVSGAAAKGSAAGFCSACGCASSCCWRPGSLGGSPACGAAHSASVADVPVVDRCFRNHSTPAPAESTRIPAMAGAIHLGRGRPADRSLTLTGIAVGGGPLSDVPLSYFLIFSSSADACTTGAAGPSPGIVMGPGRGAGTPPVRTRLNSTIV